MKKTIVILAIVVAIIAGLFFLKDVIAKSLLSGGVRVLTGLRLSIGSMRVNIMKATIRATDVKVYNPPNFPDKLMMNMPEIFIDFDLRAFLKRKTHLQELKINLKEFLAEKNKDGKLNLNSLKIVKEETGKQEKEPKKTKPGNFRVDILELKIDSVIYKDYSRGEKPEVKTFNINLHQRFYDVENFTQIGNVIISKAFMKTAIPAIAGFPIHIFAETAGSILKGATTIAVEGVEIAGKTIGESIEGAGKVIEDVLPFKKKEN